MRIPVPISLNQRSIPFDDPPWIFKIKYDGFRALALIERGDCWFVSRKHHKCNGFQDLATALVREVNAEMAMLDGELAVPGDRNQESYLQSKQVEEDYCVLFWKEKTTKS